MPDCILLIEIRDDLGRRMKTFATWGSSLKSVPKKRKNIGTV